MTTRIHKIYAYKTFEEDPLYQKAVAEKNGVLVRGNIKEIENHIHKFKLMSYRIRRMEGEHKANGSQEHAKLFAHVQDLIISLRQQDTGLAYKTFAYYMQGIEGESCVEALNFARELRELALRDTKKDQVSESTSIIVGHGSSEIAEELIEFGFEFLDKTNAIEEEYIPSIFEKMHSMITHAAFERNEDESKTINEHTIPLMESWLRIRQWEKHRADLLGEEIKGSSVEEIISSHQWEEDIEDYLDEIAGLFYPGVNEDNTDQYVVDFLNEDQKAFLQKQWIEGKHDNALLYTQEDQRGLHHNRFFTDLEKASLETKDLAFKSALQDLYDHNALIASELITRAEEALVDQESETDNVKKQIHQHRATDLLDSAIKSSFHFSPLIQHAFELVTDISELSNDTLVNVLKIADPEKMCELYTKTAGSLNEILKKPIEDLNWKRLDNFRSCVEACVAVPNESETERHFISTFEDILRRAINTQLESHCTTRYQTHPIKKCEDILTCYKDDPNASAITKRVEDLLPQMEETFESEPKETPYKQLSLAEIYARALLSQVKLKVLGLAGLTPKF